MCGLSCIISSSESDLNEIQNMNDVIVHRGPDGEGVSKNKVCDYFVGLGHRRLAILDLKEHGLQPFRFKNLELIFNGEIYNYIELRRELKDAGYLFLTDTDTEVLLKSYDLWGESCVSRFNGMFSFLVLDKNKGEIFGARDRLGIKPLYYSLVQDKLLFSSEIKQMCEVSFFSPVLNPQAAYDFLNFGITDHLEQTFFQGVSQVPAGHSFVINLNNDLELKFKNYYTWMDKPSGFEKLTNGDEFKRVFDSSIDLRLRADVLVGSCLSGGLDSSSIVSIVNQKLSKEGKEELQRTFSSCSEDERFDERDYIKAMKESFSMSNFETFPSGSDFFNDLDLLIRDQDEPFISTSIYAQSRVFKLAKDSGVTVVLDGQGADEILGGYQTFFKPLLYSYFSKLRLTSFLREACYLNKVHEFGFKEVTKSLLVRILPEVVVNILRKYFEAEALTHQYFDFERKSILKRNPKSYNDNEINNVNDFSRYLLRSGNLPMLLRFEDRNSMANSIEARVPFLDHNLVEFCLALPPEWKIYKGTTKQILRDGMRGILPSKILNRQDKMGFVTPEEVWFKEEVPSKFLDSLKESVELSKGIINPCIIEDAEAFVDGQKKYDNRFFRAICFGRWIKQFSVRV